MTQHIEGKNKLWKYRQRAGLSQKRVAYLIGIKSASHVSDWERGIKLPSLCNAFKLAYALNTFVLDLFPNLAASAQREVVKKRERLIGGGRK